jgi:hypothetical protein
MNYTIQTIRPNYYHILRFIYFTLILSNYLVVTIFYLFFYLIVDDLDIYHNMEMSFPNPPMPCKNLECYRKVCIFHNRKSAQKHMINLYQSTSTTASRKFENFRILPKRFVPPSGPSRPRLLHL